MVKESSIRFKEIIKVFAGYGFGYIVNNKNSADNKLPVNLRKAFEDLGPTFIKIGQILSTRPDLLPKEYINELSKLQDSAQEEKFENMKDVFEESLDSRLEELFSYINHKPIASASIAQVYEGVLKDGRKVVIKIQRPDILKNIKIDISILIRIIKITKASSKIPMIDPIEALKEIENSMQEELNFILEAENIKKFREYNKNVVSVYAPYVVDELVSERVLVLEKIDGIKVNSVEELISEGYDTKDIANKLALAYCKQVFEDGFFHGDPHPGNILIAGLKICFLDFGMVGQITEEMKKWLNYTMMAIATEDKDKLVNCILSIGIKKGKVNKIHLYDSVSYIFDMYLGTSIKNIKISMLMQEIWEITIKNNIQVPKELVSLIRGLIILEGVVAELDPDFEIMGVIIEFLKSNNKYMILDYLNKEELAMSVYSFGRDSLRIPTKSLELLNKLCAGEGELKFKIVDEDGILNQMHKMVNRLAEAFLIGTLIVSSSLIISNDVRPLYNGVSVIGIIGYAISFTLAVTLLISIKKSCDCKGKDKK